MGSDKSNYARPLRTCARAFRRELLEINQPATTLDQFEATLKKEPNASVRCMGRPAPRNSGGTAEASRKYFAELLKVCEHATKPGRAEVLEANKAVLENLVPGAEFYDR